MEGHAQHLLIVREGADEGETYRLQEMVCTLGRSADNTIVLDSSQISRHHAQIRLMRSGTILEDLGSTNGTFLNEQPVTHPRQLKPGDLIRLADYIVLEYAVLPGSATAKMQPGTTEAVAPPPRYAPHSDIDEAEAPAFSTSSNVPPTTPPAVTQAEERTGGRRPAWLYTVIGILVVLICLCLATAVFLWFAPVAFWEWLFDLFGIPLPSSALIGPLVHAFL